MTGAFNNMTANRLDQPQGGRYGANPNVL
jgi:hypothetical protein